MRSPSCDAHPVAKDIAEDEYQAKLVREHAETTVVVSPFFFSISPTGPTQPVFRPKQHSSGRGGAGNITVSRSRSRDPVTAVHSSGRGGAGNIHHGSTLTPDVILDEGERRQHVHLEGMSVPHFFSPRSLFFFLPSFSADMDM